MASIRSKQFANLHHLTIVKDIFLALQPFTPQDVFRHLKQIDIKSYKLSPWSDIDFSAFVQFLCNRGRLVRYLHMVFCKVDCVKVLNAIAEHCSNVYGTVEIKNALEPTDMEELCEKLLNKVVAPKHSLKVKSARNSYSVYGREHE